MIKEGNKKTSAKLVLWGWWDSNPHAREGRSF
jgi:hypothetical protein